MRLADRKAPFAPCAQTHTAGRVSRQNSSTGHQSGGVSLSQGRKVKISQTEERGNLDASRGA